MYPTLSHLIEGLTGIFIPLPIQTFGFFVAISFLLAHYFLVRELKRKQSLGVISHTMVEREIGQAPQWTDLIVPALVGFLMGYKGGLLLTDYAFFVEQPQEALLSTKGLWWTGLLLAAYSAYDKYRKIKKDALDQPKKVKVAQHPYQLVGNMTFLAAAAGLLGAKIFHNLENWDELMANPWDALLSFSGLTFYGGLICGAGAVIWYARKHKIPALVIADATAPSLMIAYGVGRIGCHLSGDGDWGIVNTLSKPSFLPDWAWAYTYPNNVIRAGERMADCTGKFCYELAQPVWPTPLYEALFCITAFILLWKFRHRMKTAGSMLMLYLIINGLERFLIEKIRVNTEYPILGGITQAEIISFCLVLAGIVGWIFIRKNKTKHA